MRQITSIKDEAYKEAAALLKPAERASSGRYLVEGTSLVQQALRSPSPVYAVFATAAEALILRPLCLSAQVPFYVISEGLLSKLVGTGYETAVTALAIVGQRMLSEDQLPFETNTLLLAGERIQDPRNVGVLIRTTEAAGCAALLLSSDSAEPFARAAVRSTTGSILRLPLCITSDLPFCLTRLRERGARVLATSARAEQSVYDLDLREGPLAMLVGNESEGVSEAARAAATDFASLPMTAAGASSLNVTVAAGVLLYEAVRQRRGGDPT